MKKFKTRKKILECPETKRLLFEFLQEMGLLNDEEVEIKITHFIERKMKQCKNEGI